MTNDYSHEASRLLATESYGTLSTTSVATEGYPFGSIVPYCLDSESRIIIYISFIAEHYKNLRADPRACLLVEDRFDPRPPQERARAAVLTRFEQVSESERDAVASLYERRFPQSINYEIAHNFCFMIARPERIRWIGGFGEVGWVKGSELGPVDPIALGGASAIAHMNSDHRDALESFAAAFARGYTRGAPVWMTAVWSGGIRIVCKEGERFLPVDIPFEKPVSTSEELRAAIIEMLRRIR